MYSGVLVRVCAAAVAARLAKSVVFVAESEPAKACDV
jgi:hypothetical protein